MAAASRNLSAVVVVLACAVAVAVTQVAEAAVSCDDVRNEIAPCFPAVVVGGGTVPLPMCCDGVKAVKDAAKSAEDRQDACRCIKSVADGIPYINYTLTAELPRKCRVQKFFMVFSNTTDCSKIN
ncbi:non-specific lipid-transfer protein 3-like [Malania oleifera]|uniref:non-specific lipid-transfer protein 3-like n=1 Tax=Malania oleifera TaxID=397392 RepID=UPI0025AD9ED0|nr:non-specific lipid-transfer protein 3-like [Malania oleifera]